MKIIKYLLVVGIILFFIATIKTQSITGFVVSSDPTSKAIGFSGSILMFISLIFELFKLIKKPKRRCNNV